MLIGEPQTPRPAPREGAEGPSAPLGEPQPLRSASREGAEGLIIAFPTEQREAQKEREKRDKGAGIQPKRRPKPVEDHHDDCGTDLTSLPGLRG